MLVSFERLEIMEYEYFAVSCSASSYFYESVKSDVDYCLKSPRPGHGTYWTILYRSQRELRRLCVCPESHLEMWRRLMCHIDYAMRDGK